MTDASKPEQDGETLAEQIESSVRTFGCTALDKADSLKLAGLLRSHVHLHSDLQHALHRAEKAEKRLAESHRYSPETLAAYGAAIEASFPDDPEGHIAALKELFKSVHCDVADELRGPHTGESDG
jgi:hypothetical protein